MTTPNIGLLSFWASPDSERHAAFAHLRSLDQPQFFSLPKMPLARNHPGFYALVRHADVSEASRNATVFSSEPTANSFIDFPPWLAHYFGSMINMDDPRHAQIRRVVSRAFSPKILARTEENVRYRAARIVDDLLTDRPRDFVAQVAARLPIEVICDMMGIPERHHAMILSRTNVVLGHTDPEYIGIKREVLLNDGTGRLRDAFPAMFRLVRAGNDLHRLIRRLGRKRIKNPTDDVISALVNANVDGERLTPQELASFFILLVVAGNETTRTAIAHALKLFTDHPDQRKLLLDDFDGHIAGAVEEVIRFTTPVTLFRRNLTQDCELGGRRFRAGDMVVLFYNAANRDETVFPDPDRFDITRSPNPHLGFGGPGPHYCLGAHLARREITIMLRELFTRAPDIHSTGEPDRLLSHFINGIKRMPFSISPQRQPHSGKMPAGDASLPKPNAKAGSAKSKGTAATAANQHDFTKQTST